MWILEAKVFGHKYADIKTVLSSPDNPFSAMSTGLSINLELCIKKRIKRKGCLETVTFEEIG